MINTISYPIHFKDALAEVVIPLRAHVLAQIPLFALWNSKCPLCVVFFLDDGMTGFSFFFFSSERRQGLPRGLMNFQMPQNKF